MRPTSILALLLLASLLAGRALGTPEDDFRRTVPAGEFLAKIERGGPIEALRKTCVFGLCGVSDFRRKTYSVVVTSTPEERRSWLADVREIVAEGIPEVVAVVPESGIGRGRLNLSATSGGRFSSKSKISWIAAS